MEEKTPLAGNIEAAGLNARYDETCKRLLSYKNVLAWILKECVEEYRDCTVEEIAETYIENFPQISRLSVHPDDGAVVGANTEDSTISEGTVTYDIRFYATAPATDGKLELIINLEAQNTFHPGYSLVTRGIYYCSRMISAQYGKEFSNSNYQDIKKVYSIWVCLKPPQERENTITKYMITEKQIEGDVREEKRNYDLLTTVMICLGKSWDKTYHRVLRLLEVLLSSQIPADEKKKILQNEFAIRMAKEMEGDVTEMCNLSQGVEQRGIEKGIAQGMERGIAQGMERGIAQGMERGIAQGMERGMAQGMERGRNQTIKELLKSGMSAEQLSGILHMPKEEIEKLR